MKKISLGFLFFFCVMVFPPHSHAQSPFGGLNLFMFPCTCSSGYTVRYFYPLFLGTAVPVSGFLTMRPTPTKFLNYYLHPGAWALGFYTPGVPECQMYYGATCGPYPLTLGVITPMTGTSP